ncbi:Hypothetical predicted protein [Mytilus galloprovincialis]|uniref:Uncharacterized protein n=1 Tax=Mytilus galloprovincialis TaxID=29158 RepID=A0A8B6H0D4_MYTGA|nr:Hypothetical predicted protein [Mytilus galloprovincialis]
MRWECQTCDGDKKSLCTECYMSDKHTEDEHMFSVIVEPSDRSTSKSELASRTNASKTRCYDEESATGEVLAIIGDFIEYGRNAIMVQWFDDEDTKEHNILELICEEASIFPYYPDHLPILGKDTLGYLDVNFNDEHISKKIEVEIWYKTKKEKRYSYKPVLYLIFANHEQMDKKDIKDKKLQKEDEFALMDEVLEFSSTL